MSNQINGFTVRDVSGLDTLLDQPVSSRDIQGVFGLTYRHTLSILKVLLELEPQYVTTEVKHFFIVKGNTYITVVGNSWPLRGYKLSQKGIERFQQEIAQILKKGKTPKVPNVSLK